MAESRVSGGEKFQAAVADILRQFGKGGTVKIGFLAGATYASGTNSRGVSWEGGKPVALIAAIQNYGAPKRKIPPRPFFSNMVKDKSPEWPAAAVLNLKATHYNVEQTLQRMGLGIKGQLQQSIVDTNAPLLKPATVARKGFSKPLVDTGHMLNSVDYEVNMK